MKSFVLCILVSLGAVMAKSKHGKSSFGADPWPVVAPIAIPAPLPIPVPVAVPATTCSTVMDEVWEEKCKTIYNDVCVTDQVPTCQVLNGKMCRTVFDDVCSLAPKTQCSLSQVQSCNVHTERKCALVKSCSSQSERVCQSLNKWIMTPTLEHVCETVSQKVCREIVVEDLPVPTDPWPQTVSAPVDPWPVSSIRSRREAEPGLKKAAKFVAKAIFGRRKREADPEAEPKKHGKKSGGQLWAAPAPIVVPTPVVVPAPVVVAAPAPVEAWPAVVQPQIQTRLQCDMVPKQHCKSMARAQNSEVPEEVCHNEPRDVCVDTEQCLDVPVKVCNADLKQVCTSVPVKECRGVPRKVCQEMPQKVCSSVPRETCKSQPEKVCKKFLVQRPRQVCEKPATVQVQQW